MHSKLQKLLNDNNVVHTKIINIMSITSVAFKFRNIICALWLHSSISNQTKNEIEETAADYHN